MEFADLILKHGLPTVVMAVIVMTLVGIVKIFTKGITTKKVVTDSTKKWLAKLYLLLALVFSVGVVMFYYGVILKADAWSWAAAKDAGTVWVVTSPLYQLYKQFGGRKFLVWFVGLFKGKSNNIDYIINVIEEVLSSDAPFLTDEQKEAIKTDLSQKLVTVATKTNKEGE